jgi:hypothetical protein
LVAAILSPLFIKEKYQHQPLLQIYVKGGEKRVVIWLVWLAWLVVLCWTCDGCAMYRVQCTRMYVCICALPPRMQAALNDDDDDDDDEPSHA